VSLEFKMTFKLICFWAAHFYLN